MQTNPAESPLHQTLWLVCHERDDPMVLVQTEYPANEALAVLKRAVSECVGETAHVDPPLTNVQIGPRYDVHDEDGWLATFWLSEKAVASDDGMLTSIVSPGAQQRGHLTFPITDRP